MAKSIAVLGLGKFGMSLVRSLNEMGADVMAVDKVETYVQEIANYCSTAICADLANEEWEKAWRQAYFPWQLPKNRAFP